MKRSLEPDFRRLQRVFQRACPPSELPLFEVWVDPEIIELFLGERLCIPASGDSAGQASLARQTVRFWQAAGYDMVAAKVDLPSVDTNVTYADNTAPVASGQRVWYRESAALITSWQDFEAFPWPTPSEIDFSPIEALDQELRSVNSGMKLVLMCGGVFSRVALLLGWENFAYMSADQPDLLQAIFQRVYDLRVPIFHAFVDVPSVGAVVIADDLGHRNGPLISEAMFRTYCLSYYRQLAGIVHGRGLPLLLHSCGRMDMFMPAFISDVGIQGKQSFEENATPVIAAHKAYGDRIAILGGVDMNRLASWPPDELRLYVRDILETCGPSGSYALGSGNSITNYVPLENYLILLEEWRNYRSVHG